MREPRLLSDSRLRAAILLSVLLTEHRPVLILLAVAPQLAFPLAQLTIKQMLPFNLEIRQGKLDLVCATCLCTVFLLTFMASRPRERATIGEAVKAHKALNEYFFVLEIILINSRNQQFFWKSLKFLKRFIKFYNELFI
jgi:hypothetical protein